MAAGALRPGCLNSSSSRGFRRYRNNPSVAYSPRRTQRQFAPRHLHRAPWAGCGAASAAGSLGGSPQDGAANVAAVSGLTRRPVRSRCMATLAVHWGQALRTGCTCMQSALPVGCWGVHTCLTPSFALQVGAAFPATVFTLINVIMGAGYVSIPFACRCVGLAGLTTESVSPADCRFKPLTTPALRCSALCRQGGWAALALLWLLGAVFCYTGEPDGGGGGSGGSKGSAVCAGSTSRQVLLCVGFVACAGNTVLQCCELVDKQRQQQQQQVPQAQPDGATQQHQTAAAAPAAGYEDVAGAAFGQFGRMLVSGVMYAELLGICCVYVVLEVSCWDTLAMQPDMVVGAPFISATDALSGGPCQRLPSPAPCFATKHTHTRKQRVVATCRPLPAAFTHANRPRRSPRCCPPHQLARGSVGCVGALPASLSPPLPSSCPQCCCRVWRRLHHWGLSVSWLHSQWAAW